MKLAKQQDLTPAAIEVIQRTKIDGEIAVGNVYLDEYGGDYNLLRIYKISEAVDFQKETRVTLHYQEARNWEGTEWSGSYGADEVANFFRRPKILITPKEGQSIADAIQEYREAAYKLIETKDYKALADKTGEIKDNALVSVGSKQHLEVIESQLIAKQKSIALLKGFVGLEMQKRKAELRAVSERLEGILVEFKKKITKIQRVISMIELYLGINEDIVQISDGEKASADTPINFRQQLLFMDEEVGDAADGGWDFTDIKKFDAWLIENERFKNLAPEEKCVVVFRPRRKNKHYSDDGRENTILNQRNFRTYFLIRNGDCVYRIWADVVVDDRLFPLREEFAKLLSDIREQQEKGNSYSDRQEAERLETKVFGFQQRAYMLQGLIDRTEVFHPLAKQVSMFKMEEAEGLINFIYDDELAFPTGRKPFWDWVEEINSGIQRGSRIVHSGQYSSNGRFVSSKNLSDRLAHNVGKLPQAGIYEVEMRIEIVTSDLPHYYIEELEERGMLIEKKPQLLQRFSPGYEKYPTHEKLRPGYSLKTFKKDSHDYIEAYNCKWKKEVLYIKYNPEDTVYGSWGDWNPHTRKNKVSFVVEKSDEFIFNYDRISIEDIDFYLQSRTDRPNYAYMMPILRTWKKHRLEEMKWEKEFVEFIKRRATEKKLVCKTDLDAIIWSAIDWWKHKNIWKRPITKDDTLALRMIERRIFSQKSIDRNFETYE